jgi:glycosyltransferase involved in cell wall biosynthesis
MGCRIVVSDRGDVRSYFDTHVQYCDPADPVSIREAVEAAASAETNNHLREKILQQFTWEKAARATLSAYQTVLHL